MFIKCVHWQKSILNNIDGTFFRLQQELIIATNKLSSNFVYKQDNPFLYTISKINCVSSLGAYVSVNLLVVLSTWILPDGNSVKNKAFVGAPFLVRMSLHVYSFFGRLKTSSQKVTIYFCLSHRFKLINLH